MLVAAAGIGLAVVLVVTLGASGHAPVTGPSGPGTRPGGTPARPSSPPPPARPPVGTLGRYHVGRTSLLLVDHVQGRRLLPTLVRYPVVPAQEVASGRLARGPFPLVVFAPGYRQCGGSYSALLTAWASAGYVVATVTFPLTSCGAAAPNEADLSNQPADLSHVIGALLARSARPAGVLSGLIDRARVAVAGHSDGGDAAAAVAANTCCVDHRIDAAIILAGAAWPPIGGRYFPPGTPPMLFVQGTADSWNPPPASIQLYRADHAGVRYYLSLIGADHIAPYEGRGPPEPVVARVSLDFLNRYLAGQRGAAAAMAADGRRSGVSVLETAGRLPR